MATLPLMRSSIRRQHHVGRTWLDANWPMVRRVYVGGAGWQGIAAMNEYDVTIHATSNVNEQ
jgi:hypothetical protein